MRCRNCDELCHQIGKLQRENPPDDTAEIVSDNRHRLDVQSLKKVFQLAADHIRPVIVTQNWLVGIVKTFQIQSDDSM